MPIMMVEDTKQIYGAASLCCLCWLCTDTVTTVDLARRLTIITITLTTISDFLSWTINAAQSEMEGTLFVFGIDYV